MPRSVASVPPGFSWLRAACRPSEPEVDAYAHIIANAEGYPAESGAARLYREAELQLWIWRNERRERVKANGDGPGRLDSAAPA